MQAFALPATAVLDAVVTDSIGALHPNQRRAAAWEWQCRHEFELEARSRFRRLADSFSNHHAPDTIVQLTEKAAADEDRHGLLCREIVEYLGASAPEDRRVLARPVYPEKMSAKSQLLYEVVAMSCVTETLSCTLLGLMVERTENPFLKQSMQSILSDEVGHSRLGWAYLADQMASGPQRLIADYLPAMLAGTVHEEIFQPAMASPMDEALDQLGVLSQAERLNVFHHTMTTVVFPGLERFDIDPAAGRIWLQQKIAQTHE